VAKREQLGANRDSHVDKPVDARGQRRTEKETGATLQRSVGRPWTSTDAGPLNFKTVCGAVRAVPGGFDSHPSPPPHPEAFMEASSTY